ncbi:transposase [Yersinia frederiksenii]|nr:transposase [Yersinia frederiksenii]
MCIACIFIRILLQNKSYRVGPDKRTYMFLIGNAFSRLHYPVDVIAQRVRWYLVYSMSLHNLEERMAECGIKEETYIKIKSQWKYLYRALESNGQTIDFMRPKRVNDT